MTNFIERDKKKRKLFFKYELERLELMSIIQDFSFSKEIRFKNQQELNKLPRNSSKTRLKKRCILTGRGHSIINFCSLSRLKFRELAARGLLMGITKASW